MTSQDHNGILESHTGHPDCTYSDIQARDSRPQIAETKPWHQFSQTQPVRKRLVKGFTCPLEVRNGRYASQNILQHCEIGLNVVSVQVSLRDSTL